MKIVLQKPPNIFLYSMILLSILIMGVNLAVILFIRDDQLRSVLADVVTPLADIFGCSTLFIATRHSRILSTRMEVAWGAIALGTFFYALGDVLWAYMELALNIYPFPSISDAFYLSSYILFIIGFLILPAERKSAMIWASEALDIGIVMLAAVLGFWNFLIGPLVLAESGGPVLELVILTAYPVADLVLLWVLLVMINRHHPDLDQMSILLIAVGIIALIVTDAIYGYQTLLGTYITGSQVDIGWVFAFILFGLAGAFQIAFIRSKERNLPKLSRFIDARKLRIVLAYMPYLWLIAAYILLIKGGITRMSMSFTSLGIGVAGIIGLVLIRQALTLNENKKLNDQLQRIMDALMTQASNLEKGNQELQDEIQQRKSIEKKLSYDAMHDGLTNLPNRTLLLERLERAIEHVKRFSDHPYSVLFLDLDHFKVINDSLGHSMGDLLLIQVSQRLIDCVRSTDTVARLGGDEFVVMLEIMNNENDYRNVSQRIQDALQRPFTLNGNIVHLSASIGVIKNIIGYDYAEDVLRDADIAMYQAKTLGKARCEVFDTPLRTQVFLRQSLENELHRGIEKKEFLLYYQPIIDLKTNHLTGFEALLRWQHPERGILLPAEFLPVAEESGVIISLGDWALMEACSQLRTWHEQYPEWQNVTVSVNISGKRFTTGNFVEEVEKALKISGLKPESLILEITENVLINNNSEASGIFEKLRKIGIQLYIDDFGTGYSSLGYLQHFPVQKIKIDRSFVKEMRKGSKGSELVRSIVSMAHDLGMETIAEGIETDEQLTELKGLLCSYGQGFLFSVPLDKVSAEKIFAEKILQP